MGWVLRRIGVSLLLVWIVASIVFVAIRLVPGDPAELLLQQGGAAPDPTIVAQLHEQLGLDRPFLEQYLDSFRRLGRFDLGNSLEDDSSVAAEIMQRLPRTLELIGAAALVALAIGLPTGLAAGLAPRGMLDRVASWIASLGLAATVFRMTRASVLDVSARDYVRTARAKGLRRARVIVHHVLRNALMPVVTVVALNLGTLLGGTVLVEYVFNYPGLSGLLVEAVNTRDYPMVEGIVLVISVLFVTLNLFVDLIYAALDPRVRYA